MKGRIAGYLVAGAIAAALLFYGFGRLDAILGAHDATITNASKAQLALHPALLKWRDKLRAAERGHQLAGQAAHDTATALRVTLVGSSDQRPILVKIAHQDSSAFTECSVALLSCQQRAENAEKEAADLTARLTQQLTVHDRRCGLFAGLGSSGGYKAGAGATLAVGCRIFP